VHHNTPARARAPSCDRRAKTLRSRMRQIKPTACGGPCPAEPSARHDLHGCSCGCGSRACEPGDGCSVGRCASTRTLLRRPRWRCKSKGPHHGRQGRSACRTPGSTATGAGNAENGNPRPGSVKEGGRSVPPRSFSTRCGQACGQYVTD
jgi:hypothetical protein